MNTHSKFPGLRENRLADGRRPDERPLITPRVVTSESLFRGAVEIGIDHQGQLYRLKITRQGKLILNK